MNARDVNIDTLRGLACMALVFFHAVGTSTTGFRVEAGSLREFNDFLALIRMPLFTFLSGYVFAIRPYVLGETKGYLMGKARRLLFPLLFAGTIFAVLQSLTPGTNSAVDDWYLLHIIPVGHFWYIESLFLIFLFVIPLTILKVLDSPIAVLFVIGFFLLLSFGQPYSSYFGFKGFVYLVPYFFIGFLIRRYLVEFTLSRIVAGSAFTLVLVSAVYFDYGSVRSLMAMCIGALFCIFLYYLRLQVPLVARVGHYSYSIFIYHVFFTAAARIMLELAIDGYVFYKVIVCTFFGIVGPIILYRLFRNIAVLRPLAFGEAYVKGRSF
jgi:fucose 4-O-acetylase-like acetyltransferase